MNILISYHNFCRDFRGSLLLKAALEALGHRVWVRPHWNDEQTFIERHPVDVIVACQIAEQSTAYIAKIARENGLHLVINPSEPTGKAENRDNTLVYDLNRYTEEVVAFHSIPTQADMEYVRFHPKLKQKDRYRLIGFPRYDISIDSQLRHVGEDRVRRRYGLGERGRCILYLSSLLFEETYCDVSPVDMERWNYKTLLERSHLIRRVHEQVLKGLLERFMGPSDCLLIKKHPWDVSNHFIDTFHDPRVRIVDPDEYIVPCLAIADFVLHSYSTSSVEAWIMGKPTIAILPEPFRSEMMMVHMSHEIFADTLDDVIANLEHYPHPGPIEKVWDFLGPQADGKATLRLARAIHELPAPPRRKLPSLRLDLKLRRKIATWREENGLKRRDLSEAGTSAKYRRFLEWENGRRAVISECAAPFRDYVERNQAYLRG